MSWLEVHVPVETLQKRIERHSTAADAEVSDVVGKPDVLGLVAQRLEPGTVEGRESDEEGALQEPGYLGDAPDAAFVGYRNLAPARRDEPCRRLRRGGRPVR